MTKEKKCDVCGAEAGVKVSLRGSESGPSYLCSKHFEMIDVIATRASAGLIQDPLKSAVREMKGLDTVIKISYLKKGRGRVSTAKKT